MYVLVKVPVIHASHLTGHPAKSSKVAKLDEGWRIRARRPGRQTWQTGKSPKKKWRFMAGKIIEVYKQMGDLKQSLDFFWGGKSYPETMVFYGVANI